MKLLRALIILFTCCFQLVATGQIETKLKSAFSRFESDKQLKYGLAGLCVIDAKTGKVIFEHNGDLGMVPASTLKVITSIAAFEALGPGYQYVNRIGYTGTKTGNTIHGDLVITGSGDPTFGSFRFKSTKMEVVLKNILEACRRAGIDSVTGNIVGTDKGFDLNAVPNGWTWSDIGNYYGAGHWAINWNENQYDLLIKTGRNENDPVEIFGSNPAPYPLPVVINEVSTGKVHTGDASLIYADPLGNTAIFQGKLEPNRTRFTVSGAMANADLYALSSIKQYLEKNNIQINGEPRTTLSSFFEVKAKDAPPTNFYEVTSPSLDSIVYWFLKKSVNLYGEALLKTIAIEKKGLGSTEKGLEWLDSFYTANGFDSEAMHLYDGSGLSPANRITPYSLARALYFAKSRNWFPYFYDALPVYNGMKLKSGTIGRVKCFAGYHTATGGANYIVAFMVNNYNSSPSALVNKMYSVLDLLK